MPRVTEAEIDGLIPPGETFNIPSLPYDPSNLMEGAQLGPQAARDYAALVAESSVWASRDICKTSAIGRGLPWASSMFPGAVETVSTQATKLMPDMSATLAEIAMSAKRGFEPLIGEVISGLRQGLAPLGNVVGRVMGFVANNPLPTDAVPVLGAIIRGWTELFASAYQAGQQVYMVQDPTKVVPAFSRDQDTFYAGLIQSAMRANPQSPNWTRIFLPPAIPDYWRCAGGGDLPCESPGLQRGSWNFGFNSTVLCTSSGMNCAPFCEYNNKTKSKAEVKYPSSMFGFQFGYADWQGANPYTTPPNYTPMLWQTHTALGVVPGKAAPHMTALASLASGSSVVVSDWGTSFPAGGALANQAWQLVTNPFSPYCFSVDPSQLRLRWLYYLAGFRRGLHCTWSGPRGNVYSPAQRVLTDAFCRNNKGEVIAGGFIHPQVRKSIVNHYAEKTTSNPEGCGLFGWEPWSSKDDALLREGFAPGYIDYYIERFNLEQSGVIKAIDQLAEIQRYAARRLVSSAYIGGMLMESTYEDQRDEALSTLTSEKNPATLYVDLDLVPDQQLRSRLAQIQQDAAPKDPASLSLPNAPYLDQNILNARWQQLQVNQKLNDAPPLAPIEGVLLSQRKKPAPTSTGVTPEKAVAAAAAVGLGVLALRNLR